jgi:hypothetical protein
MRARRTVPELGRPFYPRSANAHGQPSVDWVYLPANTAAMYTQYRRSPQTSRITARNAARPPTLGASSAAERFEGYVRVAHQVLDVFQADGEADRAGVDAGRREGAVV